jgi:selenocysteine lyase/cysteine desulfurase
MFLFFENNPMDKRFPVTEQCIYLNHAGIAPLPLAAARAIQEFCEEALHFGGMKYGRWMQCETETRRLAGELINAPSSQDIAFLKNTSEGISLLATGLDWQPGDNVVLLAGEFPSTRLPWQALQNEQVEIREINSVTADPETELLAAIDGRTRVLVVSAVHWETGLKLDLERLGSECAAKDIVFCVDAMQWLGAMPLDVRQCSIDFLACSSHKWLMGPEGIAITYVSASLRDRLALQQHGWRMYDRPFDFPGSDSDPATSARRYEAGSPNTAGLVGLRAALKMHQQETSAAIAARVLDNTGWLTAQLSGQQGIEVLSPSDPARQSGIVLFKLVNRTPAEIYNAFKDKQIVCARRADGIRLSPHFYTPREQLQITVAEILKLL